MSNQSKIREMAGEIYWMEPNADGTVAVCMEADQGMGPEAITVATFHGIPGQSAEAQAQAYMDHQKAQGRAQQAPEGQASMGDMQGIRTALLEAGVAIRGIEGYAQDDPRMILQDGLVIRLSRES